jgi:hypothetical protein
MKKFNAATCLVALAIACLLIAARSHAQTLEVHESGTGMGTVDHWRSYSGSYNRDYHQTKKIRIIVRDMSRRSLDAEVRVYFIGHKQPQWELYIYNHAILPVHFGGNMEVSDEIDAPALFLNEKHYWDGDHYAHGAAMEGWIVEGRVGSRVFGTAASNQNLLAIAKSDALRKMIAAAGIREPQPKSDGSPAAIQPPSEGPSIPARALSTPWTAWGFFLSPRNHTNGRSFLRPP